MTELDIFGKIFFKNFRKIKKCRPKSGGIVSCYSQVLQISGQ